LHRVRLQLSGRRAHAAAGGARQRLPAHAGTAVDLRIDCDRGEHRHGPPQPRARPACQDGLTMSQLQPTIELARALPPTRRARVRLPGWLTLLLRNPKSRVGLVILGFMVVVALIAPLISVSDPTA